MKLIEFSRLLNKLICISYILTGKLGAIRSFSLFGSSLFFPPEFPIFLLYTFSGNEKHEQVGKYLNFLNLLCYNNMKS